MTTQLSTQESTLVYQAKLIFSMDMERNQLNFSLLHPSTQSLPTIPYFKMMNLSINVSDIPLPDKINPHKHVGEILL